MGMKMMMKMKMKRMASCAAGARENAVARWRWRVLDCRMVPMPDIKRYCDAIAAAFQPRRIILFGSHAHGQPGEDSDVDVLVVMRDARQLGRHPAAVIRTKVRADFPVDMLVRDEKRGFATREAAGLVHAGHHGARPRHV